MNIGIKAYNNTVSSSVRGTTPENIFDAAVLVSLNSGDTSDNRMVLGYLCNYLILNGPTSYETMYNKFGVSTGDEYFLFDRTIDSTEAFEWCYDTLINLEIFEDPLDIVSFSSKVSTANLVDYTNGTTTYDFCSVSKCMANHYATEVSSLLACACDESGTNTSFPYSLPINNLT